MPTNEALQRKTEELARSEERYRYALMAGRLVHWETDVPTRPGFGAKTAWRCSVSS